MAKLDIHRSTEPDDSLGTLALGLAMAAAGSLAYLLLVWAAVHLGVI